jgi:hypothetical protein
MTRWRVHLSTVQEATLEVDAPGDATDDVLRELALQKLDDSAGAEWETTEGTESFRRINQTGEEGA